MKFYTLEEIAELTKTSRRGLYNHLKAGKLQAVKPGKHWLVSEENLQAYLAGNQPEEITETGDALLYRYCTTFKQNFPIELVKALESVEIERLAREALERGKPIPFPSVEYLEAEKD